MISENYRNLAYKILRQPVSYDTEKDLMSLALHIKEECDDAGWCMRHITNHIKENWLQWAMESKDGRFEWIYRQALQYEAPYLVDSYFRFIEFDDKRQFYAPRAAYMKPIITSYQDLLDGKLDLLTISQPKRTGKSSSALRLVTMLSGKHPEYGTLATGRGEALVNVFYSGCNDIFDKTAYREVFPGAKKVKTNADKMEIDLRERHMFPTVQCRPIDGAIVGSTEAHNLLYIDDAVAGHEEAMNRTRLDTLKEKILGDVLGRRIEGCPILMQGTRYSIYDPIGVMLDKAEELGWRYREVAIPALDLDTDESNFECIIDGKRQFTTEYYRNERKLVTAFQWDAEFQQQPVELHGRLFPEEDLRRFMALPADVDPDTVVAVCDTAESGNDFTSLVIASIYGDDVYIIDNVYDDSTAEITKPEVANALIRNKVVQCQFESNNAGQYYARDVDNLVKEAGGKCSITTKRTISNKMTRIEVASDGIIQHFLFKDKKNYKFNDQYGLLMKELTNLTRNPKSNKHDDGSDSLSMLENYIRDMRGTKAVVIDRSLFRI